MITSRLDFDKRRYRNQAMGNDLYKECKYIEAMFRYTDTVHCFINVYKLIRTYLELKESNADGPSLQAKVADIVAAYGYSSQFWMEWKRTKRIRSRTRKRVFFLLRTIQNKNSIKKGSKLTRHDNARASSFASAAGDFLRRLKYAPLTDNQYNYLVRTEHILGIYWTDLSQGENGLAPRKEEEKWRLEG